MIIYGTGVISVEGEEVTHIPAGDIHIRTDVEFAKVKKIQGRKGKIVAMDELKPLNRKQRRIKASKDRRNGRNGRVSR